MTALEPLASTAWWRLLLERLGRQAAQTAVPLFLAIGATGGRGDLTALSLALAGALVVTVVKGLLQALTDIHATEDSPLGWQLLDRAVPAFAGVFAGLWPTTVEGLTTFDLRATLFAAAGAAVTAVLAYFVTPPALVIAASNDDGSFTVTDLPDVDL